MKTIAFLLMLIAVAGFCETNDTGHSDEYLQGMADGQADGHGFFIGYFLAGCTVIGLFVPFVTGIEVPVEKLIGKSADYVEGYSEGYKNKVRGENITYALIGTGTSVVIAVIGLVILASAADNCFSNAFDNCGSNYLDACLGSSNTNCSSDSTRCIGNLMP
jgi:hypothetical protein